MKTLISKTKKDNYSIELHYDFDPENPRTAWDNLCSMALFHRRYDLPNDEKISLEEAQEIAENSKEYVSLAVFGYDHGQLTINCSAFSCAWDSGQLGIIYVSRDKLKKEGLSDKTDEQIKEYLKSEVDTFDKYLTGQVYGYVVKDEEGNELDSCWGFYGEKDAIEQAESMVNSYVENDTQYGERR